MTPRPIILATLLTLVALLLTACATDAPEPDTGPVEDRLPFATTVPTTEPPAVVTTTPPTAPAPTTARPTTTARPATTVPATSSAYYANCAEARAAGAAPMRRGEPGYRPALDRDDDGVACETDS